MIEAARQAEWERPCGVHYEVHDITAMPTLGAFDVVTAADVLHYADRRRALERMCRSAYANLAPGGRMLALVGNPDLPSQTPQRNGFVLHRPAGSPDGDPFRITVPTDPPAHLTVHHWSRRAYEDVLRGCGFTGVTWEPVLLPEGDSRQPVNLLLSARRPLDS